jgi:hypothetical protein
LLGGTAGASTTLNANFVATPSTATALASDVVALSGTQNTLHVVQMSYDPTKANALPGGESQVALLEQDPNSGIFKNAILGDSDGGARSQQFSGAYNPNTEFAAGNYGVDTANHVVWAVVDGSSNSSDFAVGSPSAVPEPATGAMLGVGVALLGLRRRRRDS